jgi:hypothetical protein
LPFGRFDLVISASDTPLADLLSQTLEEENQTEVTQKAIMPEALACDEEGDGDQRGGSRPAAAVEPRDSPGFIA